MESCTKMRAKIMVYETPKPEAMNPNLNRNKCSPELLCPIPIPTLGPLIFRNPNLNPNSKAPISELHAAVSLSKAQGPES